MSSTVSKSPKPDDHIPSRVEKDDSYSTGAGRKCTEKPKPDGPGLTKSAEDGRDGTDNIEGAVQPPIGLENETKGEGDIASSK